MQSMKILEGIAFYLLIATNTVQAHMLMETKEHKDKKSIRVLFWICLVVFVLLLF